MNISDEAVEAAAVAVKAFYDGKPPRGTRAATRHALEAAAPFLKAEAWDEGREADDFEVSIGFDRNPYRSQA